MKLPDLIALSAESNSIRNLKTNVAISKSIQALRTRSTTAMTRFPFLGTTLETLTLFIFTAFFLFYGLVPIFGGDGIGLVGADEPRYAQVAREMLNRHDYVTPILWQAVARKTRSLL